MSEKKKELTEMQQNFLDALFGEAEGNPTVAKRIAGYADSVSGSSVAHSLYEEIVERAKKHLASQSAKAAFKLIEAMDRPSDAGTSNKLKAATEVLNRAGVKEKEEGISVPESGIIILPAKKSSVSVEVTNDDEG